MERGAGSSKKSSPATGSGSSQPYHECPICKHGFTNGQALGGHMNIHRRDRASRRPGHNTPAAATGTASPQAPPPMSFGGASSQVGQQPDGEAETGGLDLELRLGRHPGWQ